MNKNQNLSAKDELDVWLDDLQGTMTGSVVLIYDACKSGSFVSLLTPPSGKERIVITSSSDNERASFVVDGNFSFSYQFCANVFCNPNLFDAFDHARGMMAGFQTAWLDGNGDGIGYDEKIKDVPKEDKEAARNILIGERFGLSVPPEINKASAEEPFSGSTSAAIHADIAAYSDIKKVSALISRPDYEGSPENPATDVPAIELTDTGGGVYEGIYDGYDSNGTYRITVYAENTDGIYSQPVQLSVVQRNLPDGDVDGDQNFTLKDAVAALKVLGGEPATLTKSLSDADVNGDNRIGLAELIYVLKRLAR
jgi:hypothetical protein